MSLSSKVKELLNKFADTQVALNDKDLPRGQSQIQLGDLLDEAHGSLRSMSVTYTPARDGGTSGSTYSLGTSSIPAGAIITRAWIAENSNVLAGAGATLDITVGATSLTGGAQLFSAFAGVLESAAAPLSATLPETTTGGVPKVAIAVANVTGGQLLVTIEYIYPVN